MFSAGTAAIVPRNWSRAKARRNQTSFPAEHFLQQRGRLGGRVLANLLFLFSEHVEQAIEGFANNVFVDVELPRDRAAAGSALHHPIVLLYHANVLHGSFYDGRERCGEIGGTGPLEIFGGGGVAAG